MSNVPLVFTVREVMQLLRLSRAKVYVLIEEGVIDGFKLGADWRVTKASVEKLIGTIPPDAFENGKLQTEKRAA